jgi:hypothetical protein
VVASSAGNVPSFYVADIANTSETQYFQLVRKIRCDEFDRTIFMFNPPDWTIGWARRELLVPKTVSERCVRALRERAISGEIDTKGGNGILVDGKTWELVGDYKIGADAWLVKFGEPSDDEIRKRLHARATQSVDILQLITVLNWIEKHREVKFVDDLIEVLPTDFASHPTRGWGEGETRALKTISILDGKRASPWLEVLKAGVLGSGRMFDPDYVVAADRGEHAMLSGQMLGCSGRRDVVPDLESVLRKATIAPHKLAAAKALVTLGEREIVKSVATSMKPSPVQQLILNMAVANLPYTCKRAA